MSKLKIWTPKQIKRYDHPPEFSDQQRLHFLTLPESLQSKVGSLHTLNNQVGFTLMVGYFLARKRFFSTDLFIEADIAFVCRQQGAFSFAFDREMYKRSTYTRHRRFILDSLGFEPFDLEQHSPLIDAVIHEQIHSFEEPARVLNFILEWLEQRRIERPTYHAMRRLLTKIIRARNRNISAKLQRILTTAHRQALDPLVEADTHLPEAHRTQYLLTSLRSLSPADSPKQIRANIDKLTIIDRIHQHVSSVLEDLDLNDKAIRFFGELVLHAQPFQIQRRKDPYLLLLGFCAHQLRSFHDWMIDTFLSVVQRSLNRATAAHQDDLFVNRRSYRQVLRQTVTVAQGQQRLLHEVQTLIWSQDMPARYKIAALQDLLPPPEQQTPTADSTIDYDDIRQCYNLDGVDDLYRYLEEQSQALQQRATPILRCLHFDPVTSDPVILQAITYFQQKQGVLTPSAPVKFLDEQDQNALLGKRFNVSLYKILLFRAVAQALKSGRLNLLHSYRYKAFDDYLIDATTWHQHKQALLHQANLDHLQDHAARLHQFRCQIHEQFQATNTAIVQGKNPHFRLSEQPTSTKSGRYHVKTPQVAEHPQEVSLLPGESCIPLTQILATVHQATGFLDVLIHHQPHYRKKRPENRIFLAAITAFGCNLGLPAMAKAALLGAEGPLSTAAQLANAVHGYFALDNIERACNQIIDFTQQLDLAKLRRTDPTALHTASDGQKIKVASTDTIYASYSFKYFGRDKGVSAYSFLDERNLSFYSTIFNPSDREAWYVLDGLLHNPLIRSTWHTTDSHGYTEAVFALMDLLGFDFAPVIAKLYKQKLYSFKQPEMRRAAYAKQGYALLPSGYIDADLLAPQWDMILRLMVSLKLKYCTASQVFKRFNSYSRQHPLYVALKEYGRLPKTMHVLRYVDNVDLRQLGRSCLNGIEHDNRFSKAVFSGNGGEMIFLTRLEQQVAEACKRLIKNAIVCWNYLFVTRQLQQMKDEQLRHSWLEHIQTSSMTAWRHVYFNGFYDFSDDKLADAFEVLHAADYALDLT